MNKTRFKADHRDRISFHFFTHQCRSPSHKLWLNRSWHHQYVVSLIDSYPKLYTDSYMTTTNISPSSIVVEVLRDDNYDDWSACMKSYMLAQDLWDFIEHTGHHEGDQEVDSKPVDHQEGDQEVDSKPVDNQEGDSKALRRKNAAALHAIQVSCAPHMLSKIRSITSAKDAWDTLANLQRQHSPSHKEQSDEAEPSEDDESQGSEQSVEAEPAEDVESRGSGIP